MTDMDQSLDTLRSMADPDLAARVREEVDAMGVGQLRLLVEAHLLRDISAEEFVVDDDEREELGPALRSAGYVPDWESGLAFDRADDSFVWIPFALEKIEEEARDA